MEDNNDVAAGFSFLRRLNGVVEIVLGEVKHASKYTWQRSNCGSTGDIIMDSLLHQNSRIGYLLFGLCSPGSS